MMVERKTFDEGGYVRCDVSVIVTRTKPANVRGGLLLFTASGSACAAIEGQHNTAGDDSESGV